MAHTFQGRLTQNGDENGNPVSFNFTPDAACTVICLGIIIDGSTRRTGGAPTIDGTTATIIDEPRESGEQVSECWYVAKVFSGAQIAVSIPNVNTVVLHYDIIAADAGGGDTSVLHDETGDENTSNNNGHDLVLTTNAAGDFLYSVCGWGESGVANFDEVSTNPVKTFIEYDSGAQQLGYAYGLADDANGTNFTYTWSADDACTQAACFKTVGGGGPTGIPILRRRREAA